MICKNCNKEFDGKGDFCPDCQTKLKDVFSLKGRTTDKLAEGVGATIVSGASISFATVALYLCALALLVTFTDFLGRFESFFVEHAFQIVLFAIAIIPVSFALSLVSLSLGINCINFYKNADNEKRKRPIPTLVLGILATAGAVIGVLTALLTVVGCICFFVI